MKISLHVRLLLILFLQIIDVKPSFCREKSKKVCGEKEIRALLNLKQGIIDPDNRLSSWIGKDCCSWNGISCSKTKQQVTGINLSNLGLATSESKRSSWIGPFHVSLLGLEQLTNLDVSFNTFNSTLPSWIFDFPKLEYVDLHANRFTGTIPSSFLNSSSLISLDFSNNDLYFEDGIPRKTGRLCKLKVLNFNSNRIRGDISDFEQILSGCIRNSLEKMGLGSNNISGYLPNWLGDLRRLKYLDLSSNFFSGPIPLSFANLSSLEELHLSNNTLNCTLPEFIGKLSELKVIRASLNSFKGVISESHFSNLRNLKQLQLSSLSLNVSSNWTPPFHLDEIELGSCRIIGSHFPVWLRSQTNFTRLDLSNAEISEELPDWFWGLSSRVSGLNLSHNSIRGKVPDLSLLIDPTPSVTGSFPTVDLSYNNFHGSFPRFPASLYVLDLSNNSFEGPMNLGNQMNSSMMYFSASNNRLNDTIPLSFCDMNLLEVIDLSNNHLTGEIPSCLMKIEYLKVMDLQNNNLSGPIPNSTRPICSLQSLDLSRNNLSSYLPSTLKECVNLVILDLGENRFTDNIPTWIGTNLTSLVILRLPWNNFLGHIPLEIFNLSYLQVLDLGHNNLSGNLPRSVDNLTALRSKQDVSGTLLGTTVLFREESILVTFKGTTKEYDKILSLMKIVDLSVNSLNGDIPNEITTLIGLRGLNLSYNHLSGQIPINIGELQRLESLDLSKNTLSGAIPESLSSISSLSYLNLSYNNLSGKIPSGNQLQTLLDESIYKGNPELCGPPLTLQCPGETQNPVANGGNTETYWETKWFLVFTLIGFLVGHLGFCVPLLICKSWRISYFNFVDFIQGKNLPFHKR